MTVSRLAMLAVCVPLHAAVAQRQIDLTGKPDATIAEPFTMPTGIRELPGNRGVVTDQMEHALFIVNFVTKTRTPLGRQGDGPGEYRFPMAPLAGPINSTFVLDATLRRMLTIGADGKIAASTPVPTGGLTTGVVAARGTDGAGRIYFEGNSFDAERGRFADSVAIVRWNPRDNRTTTITKVWGGGRVLVNSAVGRMSMARSITPFPSIDAWVVRPGGDVVVVQHDPFRANIIDSSGRVHAGPALPYTSIAVNAAERAAYRQLVAGVRSSATLRSGGAGPQQPTRSVADEEFPPAMPPFIASTVVVSPEGDVWIGRSHAAGDATWRYDILDRGGRIVGSAMLSVHSHVIGFGAGAVYVARTDPKDDLVYVEKYRR